MKSCTCLQATQRLALPARSNLRRAGRCQSQSGRVEPFNEGAAQVKRLVSRDRAEMLGNKVDILDKYTTEFGDPDADIPAAFAASPTAAAAPAAAPAAEPAAAAPAAAPASSSSSASSAPAAPSSPFAASPSSPFAAKAAPVATKFTGSSASPFGTASRTRSMLEPTGLTPDMGPDPIVKMAPTPGNIISRITLTQVVLFCTFTSMIGLMLGTFYVVVGTGAVRLAGIE
uniref:Uncharacterized protein n=1 Tax=Tetradesmus obliquus TaxID=3088 RepID=A0A383W3Q1_TETOB|eukprot:jgi/Sobl393_1/6170/SZX72101.1